MQIRYESAEYLNTTIFTPDFHRVFNKSQHYVELGELGGVFSDRTFKI